MRTLTRSVERGHPGPRSTSRAQLRMSGLTPPPEGSSCLHLSSLLVRPLVRPPWDTYREREVLPAPRQAPRQAPLIVTVGILPYISHAIPRHHIPRRHKNRAIPTTHSQSFKYSQGNCMRNCGNPQGGLVAATVSRSQAVRPTASAPPDAYQHLPPPATYQHLPPPAARLIPTPPATRRPRMLPRATRPVRAASASRHPPPENAPPGNTNRTERT